MSVRKHKKRRDSKCNHSEEALSRKWDRLYCMECQKESVKRSRAKFRVNKKHKVNTGMAGAFSDDYV